MFCRNKLVNSSIANCYFSCRKMIVHIACWVCVNLYKGMNAQT